MFMARMLESLKQSVWQANLDLVSHGLVTLTWGNVSAIDGASGLVVIKPSGVAYADLRPEDMVLVDREGAVVEGRLRPSSDTATHLELYRSWEEVGGVCHTHSAHGVMFAQARRPIPCFGTTHADHFHGEVPVTRELSAEEIEADYERNTGAVIVERFAALNPVETPGALVASHGPFAWGRDAAEAVRNAVALEAVARMALGTLQLAPTAPPASEALIEKHYRRKHGPKAYYGQR
jgi:L-ribulose-5-phosphate 4-epimerase